VTSQYKLITNADVEQNGEVSEQNHADREFFEADPHDLTPTVKIKGLRKVGS